MRQLLTLWRLPFVQEYSLGRYILDFALLDIKLAIEVDGHYWHQDTAKEIRRDAWLMQRGWTVLHILETDMDNTTDMQAVILERLQTIAGEYITRFLPTTIDQNAMLLRHDNEAISNRMQDNESPTVRPSHRRQQLAFAFMCENDIART